MHHRQRLNSVADFGRFTYLCVSLLLLWHFVFCFFIVLFHQTVGFSRTGSDMYAGHIPGAQQVSVSWFPLVRG